MERNPYPTDLTDEQWTLIESMLPDAKPGGRPRKTDLREVLNALFYLVRSGCQWRMIPHEFPPWKTCYNYYRAWIDSGLWDEIVVVLRRKVRAAAGRNEEPRTGSPRLQPKTRNWETRKMVLFCARLEAGWLLRRM